MKFDKTIFKRHYGSTYISRIKCTAVVLIIAVLLIVALLLLDIQIPYLMGLGLGLVIFVSIIPCLPLFGCQYVKAIKTAQRQKQRIENGKLVVTLVPEDGFTWGAIVTHTISYFVEELDSVKVTKRFLEVTGEIHLTDTYNGNVTNQSVSHFRIPRCFLGEETIIKLGGGSHD